MCFNQDLKDTSGSCDLLLPDSSNEISHRGIVDPGYPICSVHLQVLVYSTAVYVLEDSRNSLTAPSYAIL